jgi:TetR/AcrR family transcriptional repressor of mexJK operon
MTCSIAAAALGCLAAGEEPQGQDPMTSRSPGRPRDPDKREAILDAAQRLFASHGIDGCPIEAIAAAAAVSKVTVYKNFGDKGGIVEALVNRQTDRLTRQLAHAQASGGPIAERLFEFGRQLFGMVADPGHLDLEAALALIAPRSPETARRLYEAGPGEVHRLLARLLAAAAEAGEIAPLDAETAAGDLLALWFGLKAVKRRLCPQPDPPAFEVDAHLRRTVDLFLRAHAPAGVPAA